MLARFDHAARTATQLPSADPREWDRKGTGWVLSVAPRKLPRFELSLSETRLLPSRTREQLPSKTWPATFFPLT